jgi:hypothetical protein
VRRATPELDAAKVRVGSDRECRKGAQSGRFARVAALIPDTEHRWRCAHCGNLTRFDVVRRNRTREFWHLDLAGEPTVEETEVLEELVEEVRCRWCSKDDAIEIIERPGPGDPMPEETPTGRP